MLNTKGGLSNSPLLFPENGKIIESYNESQEPTTESCFTFNKNTGTITDYSDTCSKDVVIPVSIDGVKVETIGKNAFQNNQLTSVTIPNSVTDIKSDAFTNNQLPEDQAFVYKRNEDGTTDKTTVVSYGGAKKDNVVIPDNVTTIEEKAFANNNLTSVTIPGSVTSIGEFAFSTNPKLTKVINKTGRPFDWNVILRSSSGTAFVTGTVGAIQIVSE